MKKEEKFQFIHKHVLFQEADEVDMVLRHRGGRLDLKLRTPVTVTATYKRKKSRKANSK